MFLSEVGPVTYAVISNLAAPAKPKDIVLEEIFKKNWTAILSRLRRKSRNVFTSEKGIKLLANLWMIIF